MVTALEEPPKVEAVPKFSIAPKPIVTKKEQPARTPEKRKVKKKPEALNVSELKETAVEAKSEIEERYGYGVAHLTFGAGNKETNITSFDSGVLVVPETQSVVFTKHAQNREQIRSTHAFLAKPWSTWVDESQNENSTAINVKLTPNVQLVSKDITAEFNRHKPQVAPEELTERSLRKTPKGFAETEKLPSWVRGLVAARLSTGNTGISSFKTDAGISVEVEWEFPKNIKEDLPKDQYRKEDGSLDFDTLERKFGRTTSKSETGGKYRLVNKISGEKLEIRDLSDGDIRFLYGKIFGRDYSYITKVQEKSTNNQETEYLTGKRDPVYGDPTGENPLGVEVLSPQKDTQHRQELKQLENVLVEITDTNPDIESVVIDPSESLGEKLTRVPDAINRALPKWAKIQKRLPELKDILFDGRDIRLVPVIINPDIMILENPRAKSTILLVAEKHGWTSRYFRHKEGAVAEQIDDWLNPDRVTAFES